jgi:hypothetical protein
MLIFSISFPDLIKFPYFMYTLEKRVWVKGTQSQGDFTNNFSIYTYTPQNIYTGPCKCKRKYIHCNSISVNVKIWKYTYTRFTCCIYSYWHLHAQHWSLTLDLHAVYTAINTYMHNWSRLSEVQTQLSNTSKFNFITIIKILTKVQNKIS